MSTPLYGALCARDVTQEKQHSLDGLIFLFIIKVLLYLKTF